jgi:DNA replication protein DnaC
MTVRTPPPPPLPDELDRLLRRLRLPYVRRAAPDVIATAASQRWEHAEVLRVLLAEEAAGRDQATTSMRRKASGLPAGKTFDAWEPDASAIPPQTQNALRTLEWIDRHEVLVVCGPSGTGKSHFIEALGHLAIDKGRTVAWHTLETLAVLVRRHRADDSINKAIGKLIRADLILVDDVGLLPVSTDAAEALSRVIDAAYEKRSIAISSNIHPSGFDELMPKTIATATVDRLMHHAHILHRRPGQLPARASDRREASQALGLSPHSTAGGELRGHQPQNPDRWGASWPPVGRKDGHQWGEKVAADGEISMAIDKSATHRDDASTADQPARLPDAAAVLVLIMTARCSWEVDLR